MLPLASFNLPVWPNMRNVSAPFVLLGCPCGSLSQKRNWVWLVKLQNISLES